MNFRALMRLTGLIVISLVGLLLITNQVDIRHEQLIRTDALNVAAPAGSILNDAVSGNVPQHRPGLIQAIPVAMNVADLIIENELPNLTFESAIDSPLSSAEQTSRQQAALTLPQDATIQQADSNPDPLAPILSTNFDAIDYEETGTNSPPDPEIAVGNDHIVAVVNVAIQIFEKNGAEATSVIPANNFFGNNPGCDDEVLYDPNALYDEEADRFIIGFDQGPFSLNGGYCLAISQTNDPTGAWWIYFFGINDGAGWMDFPQAGVADDYIVMAGNVFDYTPSPNTNYVGAKIWAFAKSQLYVGGGVVAQSESLGSDFFTIQPLQLHGAAQNSWPIHGDRVYFLADQFDGANYSLFVWEPGFAATETATINLGQAGFPINTPQNSSAAIQSNDYRLLDFEYRNSYGWLTQTVSCNPGGSTSNCVRWAQIRVVDGAFGPAGSGTYGSSTEFRIFPDLAVNQCNDMVVGYTRSSTTTFPGIWYTGRKAANSAGTLQAEAQLKAGEVAYSSFGSDPAPHRWGDYTAMTIDPDGQRFWYIGEYSKDMPVAAKWATYIGSFSYPDCQSLNATSILYLPIITRP